MTKKAKPTLAETFAEAIDLLASLAQLRIPTIAAGDSD